MTDHSTFVIVDDHEAVRTGTRVRLEYVDWLEFVGEADTVDAAFDLIQRTRPDLAIVDMRLPDGTALDLIERLHDASLHPCIVLFSGSLSAALAVQGFKAGVSGFVGKLAPMESIVDALDAARNGRRYIDPTIAAQVLAAHHDSRPLSIREVEVLRMIADGGQNAEIAHALGISPETVKAHVSNILDKTSSDSRTHAVAKALRDGIID